MQAEEVVDDSLASVTRSLVRLLFSFEWSRFFLFTNFFFERRGWLKTLAPLVLKR